jgi:hypothetical protein
LLHKINIEEREIPLLVSIKEKVIFDETIKSPTTHVEGRH